MNYERRRRRVAKRVAPNEPTDCPNARPGMGRGRKDEVQSTKDEKGRSAECGIEDVVSGQSSVVSRVFSGDPQGSAFQLRNSECGIWSSNHESRTPQTLSGRTKPFRRKIKAAFETGRALPHVADGAARPCSRVLSSLGQGSRLNNRSALGSVHPNPQSRSAAEIRSWRTAIRNPRSAQLLRSLSALSSRVSMLKGLLM